MSNNGPSQKSVISVFDEVASGSPTRKIDGIKFNNICIDHGSSNNRLLVKWLGVNTLHNPSAGSPWAESIYDYFLFTEISSNYSNSFPPPDHRKNMDVGIIASGYQIGTNNVVTPLCNQLKSHNKCTYEKFRTATPSCQ